MSDFEPLFTKTLSRNDVGLTNSHQAGLHVPKSILKLGYFPKLNVDQPNPRQKVSFYIVNTGGFVIVNFIFYNGKDLGFGTRSEYRLTEIREELKSNGATADSVMAFGYWGDKRERAIKFFPKRSKQTKTSTIEESTTIKLSSSWRVIGKWE